MPFGSVPLCSDRGSWHGKYWLIDKDSFALSPYSLTAGSSAAIPMYPCQGLLTRHCASCVHQAGEFENLDFYKLVCTEQMSNLVHSGEGPFATPEQLMVILPTLGRAALSVLHPWGPDTNIESANYLPACFLLPCWVYNPAC